MSAITRVPGGPGAASRAVASRAQSGDGEFEIALGAASASLPPRAESPAREPDRDHDPDNGPADERNAASPAGTRERQDARRRSRADAPSAGETGRLQDRDTVNRSTPWDAAVMAGNGAQNAPAPPHPATGTATPSPAGVATDAATADLVAVHEPPRANSTTADSPEKAAAVPDAIAQSLPETPGLSVRVVASRQGAVAAGANASGPTPAFVSRLDTGEHVTTEPAVATVVQSPSTKAVHVAAASVPPGAGASVRPAAPDAPQLPSAANPAAAQARNAAATDRDATHSDAQERHPSERGNAPAPASGVTASELLVTTEPATAPVIATAPARPITTTTPDVPATVRADGGASPAAIDARFEPMRRAADQVTLQFQGEGGLEGRLRIAVRGDTVHASILSSHEGTLQRLGSEAGTLRRALGEQGFTQAKISVHDLRAGGTTNTSDSRQGGRDGDDRRQGESQRRPGQGRESRQGSDSAKDRRAARDERRSR